MSPSDYTGKNLKPWPVLLDHYTPKWSMAVDLFNNRFVDMPFTLSLFNQVDAALGKDKAKLKFTFKDGDDLIECTRDEIKSLSQGENEHSIFLILYLKLKIEKTNKPKLFLLLMMWQILSTTKTSMQLFNTFKISQK